MSLQAQSLREFSRQLRALASRSRLDILRALAAGETMTVTELREKSANQPAAAFVALEHSAPGRIGGGEEGWTAGALCGQSCRISEGRPRAGRLDRNRARCRAETGEASGGIVSS